jgi:hypothetical protein
MPYTARSLEYFYTTLSTRTDDAFELLDNLASHDINFLAVTLVPMGPDSTQLTLFPEEASLLQSVAKRAGLALTGPHRAVLVQGDDERGALAEIHKHLHREQIEIFASNAITDGKGRFGCILYLRPEDATRAVRALS